MSTCQEHMLSLCRNIFINHKAIVRLLPFQDKIDPWDIEEALKTIEEEQKKNVPFIDVVRCRIKYGDEEVDAFRIYEHPYSTRFPRMRSRSSPLPHRIELPHFDEDDAEDSNDDDEEEEQTIDSNGYVRIKYTANLIRRSRVRRVVNFYIPNAANLTSEEIKDRIMRYIADGDFTPEHDRTLESYPDSYENMEYHSFDTIDYNDQESEYDFILEDARAVYAAIAEHFDNRF